MQRIYLDHAASTPLRPEAAEALHQALMAFGGNPSSPHQEGRVARRALEEARERGGALLGVPARHLVFTRGGTESANLALFGAARREDPEGGAPPTGPVVHSALEHSAVREAAEALARGPDALPLRILPVTPDGTIGTDALDALLDGPAPPRVLSLQSVNSESGVMLELAPVLERAGRAGVPVHVDASQGVRARPDPLPPLLTLSGHKFGGPRGTGLLVRDPALPLAPLLHGGGQEGGLRPGTEDVAGALAMVAALEGALLDAPREEARLEGLRDHLQTGLLAALPELHVVGGEARRRAPHILLLALEGLPFDLLPGVADRVGVAASAGSACRSGSSTPSPALRALLGERAPRVAPLRLSLGWNTTAREVEEVLERLPPALERARAAFGARLEPSVAGESTA